MFACEGEVLGVFVVAVHENAMNQEKKLIAANAVSCEWETRKGMSEPALTDCSSCGTTSFACRAPSHLHLLLRGAS